VQNSLKCVTLSGHKEYVLTSLRRAFEAIDQFAERSLGEANMPGVAIAVTDRRQLLRVSTYGFANIVAQVPMAADTLLEIGSLGKAFTSIALLQLHDEGKVDLHAPVTQYLPWFHVQSTYPPITVHHLLNHTAGLICGTDLAPHGLYESWAMRRMKLTAPPGTYFSYSNVGYKTLGFLLEAVTKQSYQDIIASRVLKPLGMTHTYTAITLETRRRTAIGYCSFYDDRPEQARHGLVPAIWAEYGTGDGCQVSTAADMAIYLRMLLNRGRGPQGQLMSQKSFDLMTQGGVWTGEDYYGYGLAWSQVDGRTYLYHGGGSARQVSAITLDMDAGLGVVVFVNRVGRTAWAQVAAQYALTVVRSGRCHEALPPPPPATDPRLIPDAADYAGTYGAGDRVLQLAAEAGKLLLAYKGQEVVLERYAQDLFYVGHPELDLFFLEFQRDGGRVVEVLHGSDWYANDRYRGPRQFDYPTAWEAYPGHYRSHNPEQPNFRVVMRKGTLVLIFPGWATESLEPLEDGTFRIGQNPHSPETLSFDAVVEGRALRACYSGCPYYRAFTR
jgi:CubicO group peptidase (beta-lactamase class C family)